MHELWDNTWQQSRDSTYSFPPCLHSALHTVICHLHHLLMLGLLHFRGTGNKICFWRFTFFGIKPNIYYKHTFSFICIDEELHLENHLKMIYILGESMIMIYIQYLNWKLKHIVLCLIACLLESEGLDVKAAEHFQFSSRRHVFVSHHRHRQNPKPTLNQILWRCSRSGGRAILYKPKIKWFDSWVFLGQDP